MYDFHCHSLLSDGELLPAEIARRYEEKGYKAIAITDHVDSSNIEHVTDCLLKFCSSLAKDAKLKVLPGVELTHIGLKEFKPLVNLARKKGIKIVIGHGETLVEPIIKGTNSAALEAGVDILAHPGLICAKDTQLAVNKGVLLEITSRKGHSLTNGHVAKMANQFGAGLVLDNDSHFPTDIISPDELIDVGLGAGLEKSDIDQIYKNLTIFLTTKSK